ncbi:MAG TPA: metallophosphoesterase [Kofleriaceae bacterium]|nr:metallophosphoesterase [Kofleriaceae bacterium]
MHLSPRLLAVSLALAAGACASDNQSGHVAAEQTGDLSHPLAERGAFDGTEAELCGEGAVLNGVAPVLHRAPYMQRVTDTSARVVWTSDEGEPDTVHLWEPEVAPDVPTVVREADLWAMEEASPGDGVNQYAGIVESLEPDTVYCYQLDAGDDPATAAAGFRTAPAAGSGARVAFVAFGDSGNGGDDQFSVREHLETVPMQMMIHTGDIAYESGTMQQFEDNYFSVYASMTDSIPMWPSIGNHDEHDTYHQVYDLPWASSSHDYYSFDYGDVHFVALDTNDVSQRQADWLEDDLAENQREWTVVYGHHPPFSSGEHGCATDVRDLFVPIFEKYDVDLVLAGHDHDYERMVPQNGVNYVVTGGGGRGTRPMGSPQDFTAFAESVLHFVYVEVEGNQLLLHAIDATGVEFDQLAITH